MKEEFKILEDLKRQNKKNVGYSVPNDYFDAFEDKMMDIIQAEEQPFSKKLILVLKPWLSLAAIFTLIAVVYYSTPYFNMSTTVADISVTNEFTLDLISSDFDELELIDIITEDSNNDIFQSIKIDPAFLEGITYEDIEDLVIF